MSASVNLPLHHKVRKFSSGSPGLSRKKGCKTVVVWCGAGLRPASDHKFVTLTIDLCLQHVCHDVVRRVDSSVTADTCILLIELCICRVKLFGFRETWGSS